jgi:signal transduction histidine kinase
MADFPSARAFTMLPSTERQKLAGRYTIALSVAAFAVLLRWCLEPLLGHVAFYVTVYMAVTFCALICGLGPAVLSGLTGFLGIFYWFVDPRRSLALGRAQIHSIIGFFLVCAVLIWLGESNRRRQLRLNAAVVALTAETNERKHAEAKLQSAHDELERRVVERTAELSDVLAELESEIKGRKETEEQLRSLSVRLMTFQDEERRRIARDLHDTTGQTLAALKMTLSSLEREAAKAPEMSKLLSDIEALANEALQEIRTTSYLLHPPLLDEVGISSAARWFVEGFAKRSGLEVACDLPEEMKRLKRNCELVLFRVLQESLTNVHRYSGASAAGVKLRLENDRLRLEISDNGRGIPEDRMQMVQRSGGGAGVGIAGMRERVRELGGQLEIQSGATGTTVSVVLPMRNSSILNDARSSIYAD